MKRLTRSAVTVATVLLAFANPRAMTSEQAPEGAAQAHPVVVELFTSQGCSTCPPADRLLAALGSESRGGIVALAFHVDSWNHDGWTDRFSNAAWTRRHAAYARTLRSAGAYTPQAVIDGAATSVGSDERALRAAVAAAAARPAGRIALALEPGARSVVARVAVEIPPALRERKLDLLLAVYETGLETAVGRGENGGKRLHDDYVVRSLVRAGRLPAGESPSARFEEDLELGDGWVRSRLGVAAFLQDPRTLSIHGARARGLEQPGIP